MDLEAASPKVVLVVVVAWEMELVGIVVVALVVEVVVVAVEVDKAEDKIGAVLERFVADIAGLSIVAAVQG